MKSIDKDVLHKRINRSLPAGQRIRTSHGSRAGVVGNLTHLMQDGQVISCIGDCNALEEFGRRLGVLKADETVINERGRHDF